VLKKLSGKVAIVTGAWRGIGAATARVLAQQGAQVVLTDVADGVHETAEKNRENGLNAIAFKTDVTRTDQVDHMVQEVLGRFRRIDVLVNNAGIYPRSNLIDMSDEFLREMFDVNVFGMFRCARAVLPVMMKQRYGKIVNMSSVTGPMVADASGGQTAYAATKAAVLGFTVALALEVAQYGVNVNCICPGSIDTPGGRDQTSEPGYPDKSMEALGRTIPMCRLGTAEEVGELVAFLASDESSYLTGTHIVIDGGNILQETYRGPYAPR
jgi:NAD(P)-dependent dehydrogenase (short-subunit alcohol dehydrogenase family)